MNELELCPGCNQKLVPKLIESYKEFYLCINPECKIISVILTTTKKVETDK